jgi:outer membrane receptor protein involved in Fe transport
VSLALAGNLGIPLPATLPDDSITSYELGTKALLLGGRLQLEGAVYKSNWKDVTVRIPLGNTGFNGLIGSRGTETRGVEFSAMLKLDEHWSFTLAASQADGKYAGTVPGTGIRDGAPVDDNAKTTASASVDYSRTMFGDLRGTGRIGLQTNSRRDFPSFGPPQYLPGDALTVVNARLGLEGERWGVFLFADNLTDEDGALDARNVTFAGPTPLPATANRLRPRTVGLELRVNFGGNR